MDEEILKGLLKRAQGYTYDEVQEEYQAREDGELVLTKRKVMEKYCPPDSSAIKTYLELCSDMDFDEYTDEELEQEKARLLNQLAQQQNKPQA